MEISSQDELLVRNLVTKWQKENDLADELETERLENDPDTRRGRERLQKILRVRTEEARTLIERLLIPFSEKLLVVDYNSRGVEEFTTDVLLMKRFRGKVARVSLLFSAAGFRMNDGTSVEMHIDDLVVDPSPMRVTKRLYQAPSSFLEYLGVDEETSK